MTNVLPILSAMGVLWITGLGLAMMMGGPRLSGRYAHTSARLARKFIAGCISAVGDLIHLLAKMVRG